MAEAAPQSKRQRTQRGDFQFGGRLCEFRPGGEEIVLGGENLRGPPDGSPHIAIHRIIEGRNGFMAQPVAREARVRVAFILAKRNAIRGDVSIDFLAPHAEKRTQKPQ